MNWNFVFSHKNVHEKFVIFNQTLINIFLNYITSKLIAADDKDPLWMNDNGTKKVRKIMDKRVACKPFNTKKKIMMPN